MTGHPRGGANASAAVPAHPASDHSGHPAVGWLQHPPQIPSSLAGLPWWRQSLAHGAPGIALLHIERAATGLAPWETAHQWLAYSATGGITTGADSHLYYGAPALAHALTCATTVRPAPYQRALALLDASIAATTEKRIATAHQRMDRGEPPALAEFDLIRGITGAGAHLLRRDPGGGTVRAVLEYLVRLTEPISHEGEELPGWWTLSGPSGRASARFAEGHGNSGMAHGIAGPLALLALAARKGVAVGGHLDAIDRITGWLDRWRVETASGPVWPYWVNRAQLRADHRETSAAQPPSWCYGTAGLARAQQLSALATRDERRQALAESALLQALSSPVQRAALRASPSLCHGFAGLAHIAVVAAADAAPPVANRLRALIPDLLAAVQPVPADLSTVGTPLPPGMEPRHGFLEGAAGVALAVAAAASATPSQSGWDTCLLIA